MKSLDWTKNASMEGGMTSAHERKYLKYTELAVECQEAGWKARIHPVEVGCWDFVGSSAVWLLQDVGMAGANLRRPMKELGKRQKDQDIDYGSRERIAVGEQHLCKGSCRGCQGDIPNKPLPHPRWEMYWFRGRNICERRSPADDPAADPMVQNKK